MGLPDVEVYVYCIGSAVAALAAAHAVKSVFSYMSKPKPPKLTKNYPKNKVILHQFGRGKYAPSLSPFPIKLETYLRMAKIPYQDAGDMQFSSKRKTPWMEYNGKEYADSQFCMDFLNKEFGVDLNKHLSKEEKAIARAILKMAEEDLYWTLVHYRWIEMKGSEMRELTCGVMSKPFILGIHKMFIDVVYGQGIGRHTTEERRHITREDLASLSHYLGDKKFMFGDKACETDCGIFGMLSQLVWHSTASPHLKMINEEFPNLRDYCFRMKEEFWPDWEQCLFETQSIGNKRD